MTVRRAPSAYRLRRHLADPLYRNGYALVLAYGATSVLGLAYWALAARTAPVDDVGTAAALISLLMLISGSCQLSLNTVLLRFVPRAGRHAARLVVWCYALSAAATAVVAGIAALTTTWWSDELSFLATDPLWLAAFVVATAGWSVFALQDSAMMGMRQAHWVPVENVAFSVAKLVLLVPAAAAGVAGIFASSTIPALVAILPINVLIFRRLLPRHLAATAERTEVPTRSALVRFVSTNYLGSVFFVASTTLLPIIVTVGASAQDNAYFFAAWTISLGLGFVASSMMSSLIVESALEPGRLTLLCRRSLRQSLRLLVPATAAIVIAAPWILTFFGSDYADNATVALRLLALSSLPNAVVTLALSIARIRQQGALVVWIQGLACVAGVGAGAALLAPFGISGVAAGWLAGQCVAALAVAPVVIRVLWPRDAHPAQAREGGDA